VAKMPPLARGPLFSLVRPVSGSSTPLSCAGSGSGLGELLFWVFVVGLSRSAISRISLLRVFYLYHRGRG